MGGRPTLALAAAVLAAAAAGPAWAVRGRVLDPDKAPIAGAKACLTMPDGGQVCADTGREGWFELPDSRGLGVRVTASGYLPADLAAVDQEAPIVLARAASFVIRLVDAASGAAIPAGQVTVLFPSGMKKGPFPVGPAGVRVATFWPGSYRLRAEADGYVARGGVALDLEAGKETRLDVRLDPAPPPSKAAKD